MFESMFGKKPKESSNEDVGYTGETKFTEDETGAVVSQEMADADKQFKEARE